MKQCEYENQTMFIRGNSETKYELLQTSISTSTQSKVCG